MGDGFEVAHSQLEAHAKKAEAVAARVDKARAAASASTLGGWPMYGALCSPIVMPTLSALFGDSDDMVVKAAELGRSCAGGLRATKANYEAVDEQIIKLLKQAK